MRFAALLLLLPAVIAHAALSNEETGRVRGLLRERRIAEAEAAANALVASHPQEAEACALLASVRMAKGDADGAVKAAEKAVQLAPADSELRRQLGDSYAFAAEKAGMLSKLGWGKKCLAAYEKAVELDPTNLNARSSLMTVYQQAPGMMGGGSDKAYAQAAEIRKLDAVRGRVAYAMLYTGEKKFTAAFTELEEVLKTAPDHYPALYQFGRVAALSGEHIDRGMEALKKCLTLPPPVASPAHDAANWRLGNLWEKKGDKPSARAAYQAALAVNPGYQPAIDALKKLP
jgi:tetratricopeptide (TPR) repeat protein